MSIHSDIKLVRNALTGESPLVGEPLVGALFALSRLEARLLYPASTSESERGQARADAWAALHPVEPAPAPEDVRNAIETELAFAEESSE